MSRSNTLKKELFTGCHLVAITKVSQGEVTDVIVRFSNGENKSFDKVYDYTSSEFLKMCQSAGLLKNNAVFSSKDAIGARLWICIKEVWDVNGTEMLDTVNFYIFDTRPCIDPEKKPIVKGDPADNKGVPSGVFYDCRQVAKSTINWVDKDVPLAGNLPSEDDIKQADEVGPLVALYEDDFDLPPVTPPKAKKVELPAEKKKVVEAAKEMIKKVESGESPKENIFAKKLREQEEAKNKINTPDEDWDSM